MEAVTYARPKMEAGVMLRAVHRDQQLRLHPAAHRLSLKEALTFDLKAKG